MQLVIVIIILVIAFLLAARHFCKMFVAEEKGCVGCPLKDTCGKSRPERATCKPRRKLR